MSILHKPNHLNLQNWKIKTISQLADTYAGGTPSRNVDGMFGGSIPWVKSAELNQSEIIDTEEKLTEQGYHSSSAKRVPENTPLIAMYGATAGVVSWLKIRAVTNQAVLAVVPSNQETDARWLYWILNFYSNKLIGMVQGSGQPNLNKSLIDELQVAQPLCCNEQRRIAEILDTIDETIALTSSLIAKLKQIRAGLLQDLLTRGLDEDGKLRDAIAHPEQFQDSPLGRIPKDWEVRTCESVCKEIVVGIVIKPSQYYLPDGVPVMRSANVREAGLNPSDLVFMSEQSNRLLAKSMIRTGDVLTVRTGYPGTSCVVPPEFDGANCIDIIISRPTTEIKPEFLATWINSDFGKCQVLRVQGGLAQQHFNVGQLQKLLLAKPPFEEQQAIQVRLNAHDTRLRTEEAYLNKLKLKKKGLMHDLLTGRVRVNTSEQLSA